MITLAPGVSPCPALAGDHLCGLLWRHDGNHVPFVPGEYLPPSLLHPIDVMLAAAADLPWWRCRCPLCGAWSGMPDGEVVTAFRGGPENWDRVRAEWQWTFWPCGCVGRTVPDEHDKAPARKPGLEPERSVLHEALFGTVAGGGDLGYNEPGQRRNQAQQQPRVLPRQPVQPMDCEQPLDTETHSHAAADLQQVTEQVPDHCGAPFRLHCAW